MLTLFIAAVFIAMTVQAFLGSLTLMLLVMCPIAVIATGFFSKNVTAEWGKRIISWLVSVGICFAVWGLKWNAVLADLAIWQVAVLGVIVGLVNNGIYSISQIQELLENMGAKKES